MRAKRALLLALLVVVFLAPGVSVGQFEAGFVSMPTRLHVKATAFCSVGGLDTLAYANEEFPQFSAVPRFKVALVPFVTGTQVFGASLLRLASYKNLTDFLKFYSPNLHFVQIGEDYKFFSSGLLQSQGKLYSSLAPAGIGAGEAKLKIQDALKLPKVNWTMGASETNFEQVDVFAAPQDEKNLRVILSDAKSFATGDALSNISQGFFPQTGYAQSDLAFSVCHPYTVIPTVYAQDNFFDFKFRPIGATFEQQNSEYVQVPSSELACSVKSHFVGAEVGNVSMFDGLDGVRDVSVDFKVRYQNEFRFDYLVDPPEISGSANLPLVTMNSGISNFFDEAGSEHKAQGLVSLSRFYKWIRQTDTGYSNQKVFLRPAVYDRVTHESKYWELSHFKVTYPEFSFDGDRLAVEEKSVDIEPIRFEEISLGRIAYFNFTNMPLQEGKPSTFFTPQIDRPCRVEAVYEPGELSARGKTAVAESTRLKLNWGVTPQMKDMADRKHREYGDNWWKKGFPTFYNVVVKGDAQKKVERIDPTKDSVIVDGLKPGGAYTWELSTWVSDSNGSAVLQNTWQSGPVKTTPLPKVQGICGQTSAIQVSTAVDEDGDEVWKVRAPMNYELSGTKLEPTAFLASAFGQNQPRLLLNSKMVKIGKEKDGITYYFGLFKILQFHDAFVRDDTGANVIFLDFKPKEVRVEGEAVDELMRPIGRQLGGQIGNWWPAVDGTFTGSPIRFVEAPMIIKSNKYYRFKAWRWVGQIFAARMPFEDMDRGMAVLAVTVKGCQPDTNHPVTPKIYAVYEDVPVECFTVQADFAVNWKQVPYSGKIPIAPEPDCPGKPNLYMLGSTVTIGPAPKQITVKDLTYKFVGWIIGETTIPLKDKIITTVDKAYTVYANYQPASNRFQIYFTGDADGRRINLDLKFNPKPDVDGFYNAGTVVRIGPVPKELDGGKYYFIGWALDGVVISYDDKTDLIEVMMDKDHKVVALYRLSQ